MNSFYRGKILITMKLTLVLLISFNFVVQASSYGQKVNLNVHNKSIVDVFDAINEQTNYRFLYASEVIKENASPVTLTLKDESINRTLSQLFKNQNLEYEIIAGTINVKAKKEKTIEPLKTIQQQVATGMVKDEYGEPLIGVTVLVKGTTKATTTNVSGVFSIPANSGDVLIFSYIGFLAQEVSFMDQSSLDVMLKADNTAIEEVIIVGYGSQKRSEVIGSVAQVDAKQINNRAAPALSQALTGQMPGVAVVQRSGQPGASGGTIQVRGVGSFGAGTGALILVDGIPTSSFNDIDPNDVASISVLKDASSAAIYGARAANGVILVTTKMGSNVDKLKVGYNGYVGLQTPTEFPEFVNSWEYATAINETTKGGGGYTAEEIQKFKDGSDPDHYPNSDYLNAFFEPSALQTAHNFNIANKSEKGQYVISAGYLNQDGMVKKNKFERYNMRLNLTSNINDKLKVTTRLSAIQTSNDQPATPASIDYSDMLNMISNVIRYPSIYAIKLSNGDWGGGNEQKGNPISFLESESFYKTRGTDLNANVRLDWNVVEGLTLSAIGGYTQQNTRERRFRATQRINDNIMLSPSTLNQSSPYDNYKTFQALAEYTKSLQNHNLKFLAGYSFESGYNESLSAFRQGFPSNDLTELNVGSADGQQNTGTASEWALESLFGRLQYNYDHKYLLEGVLRYDGSSRFPTSKKYALFPSFAAGWRIGQESFLKENVTWLNELKIKGSYGILGNQNIGNYPYQNILNTGQNYPFGGNISTGVARTTVVDATLRWESTRTADVGIEASALQNKLTFSATYFDRYTYDILVSPSASVSNVLGFDVGVQNSGKLKNKGWEFTLGYKDRKGDWGYSADANLTYVNNNVIDLGVGNVNQPNGLVGNGSLFVGHPMQLYYGYVADGLFVDGDDVNNWVNQSSINPNAQPGDVRYKDISGPDGVPDGKVDATYDRVVLGSQIAKYNIGLNLGLNYKNLDVSILLQGVTGVNGYLNNYAGHALYLNGNIQRWQYDGRWTPENPNANAEYPRIEQLSNTGTPNTLSSSFWMLDGSYLRLKNVQVGYTFDSQALKNIKIEGLRVYMNAENLHTWSKYRKGWDPEVNTGGAYYPILRNFTLGVNVNF